MLPMIVRCLRAFTLALKMTLRGEKPPALRYPALLRWSQQASRLLDAVYAAAEAHGLDKMARQQMILHIDSRDISMETILSAVRYHLTHEYPSLMRSRSPYNLVALYASNLNDCHRVARLSETVGIDSVKNALSALRLHLDSIPSSIAFNASDG